MSLKFHSSKVVLRSLHSEKGLNAKRWMLVWNKAVGNVKRHNLIKPKITKNTIKI